MRKFILSIASVAVVLTALSSCLGDAEELTTCDDAAITTFSVGTLNRHILLKNYTEDDSIQSDTIDCSDYVFHIDHINGKIWNTDSLPFGVDPSKVPCTIAAKNSEYIYLKSLTSDSLLAYDEDDSLDFTTPREITAFSYSWTGKRVYEATINVHQEYGDTCLWTKMVDSQSNLGALADLKAVTNGDNLYVFGTNAGKTEVYTTNINDGKTWSALSTSPALAEEAAKSVIVKDNTLYTISDGNLLSSTDGTTWETVTATDLRQLVAASTAHLYALSSDNKMMSSADNGKTWSEEQLDEDASLLPTESMSYVTRPSLVNENTDCVLLIGNRSVDEYPNDSTAQIWVKIDEYTNEARQNTWNRMVVGHENQYKARRGAHWQIVNYDGNSIKGICGEPEGAGKGYALDCIYNSTDDGVTWHRDTEMKLPTLKKSNSKNFAMTTDKNYMVWFIGGDSGQVWKGRINRVAWEVNNR